MKQPNIVFFFADQHRWDFTGYETNGVTHTPALDRLAREGVVFRRAYCPAPLCSPSRQAIASGRHGMNSGSFTNLHQLPPGTPGFVPQFRAAGYRTCAIGKTHMEIHAYDSDLTGEKHVQFMDSLGWDECTEISANGMLKTGIKCAYTAFLKKHGMFDDVLEFYRKWHYFMDKERKGDSNWNPHPWPFESRFQESEFVTETALQWLHDRDPSQPFLLHVGFGGPHSPIEPNPTHLARYEEEQETHPFGVEESSEMVMAGRKGYRAMISQVDDGVGRIRELVEEQGELDNTIFVYLADHGEMAGDLGKTGKTSFFEASVHVPFLMSGPGIRVGHDS
ncbi:MAG: sulfatase-like hydrolase/transferase, partial [Lentisphaeria bacterium]|nr:sulfatase-like hydrolase/transferase [Lentisphaeria bacterium]